MANADYRTAQYDSTAGRRVGVVLEKTIDFAVNNHGAGDVLKLFDVYKGDVVRGAFIEVLTAEGATCTVDLGIPTVDTDGFFPALSINSTGFNAMVHTLSAGATVGLTAGYVVAADTTVDLITKTAATDAAKIRVGIVVDRLA